ncbi:hypothetical protein PENSPDRAFT_148988 [Peniophora sp. CONT]|nr:hypothetical protein PENSPDRAFT_148988 [Peniophora sp. CONT]
MKRRMHQSMSVYVAYFYVSRTCAHHRARCSLRRACSTRTLAFALSARKKSLHAILTTDPTLLFFVVRLHVGELAEAEQELVIYTVHQPR